MSPTNKEIIDKYLDMYRHSYDSIKSRECAIRHFILEKYFGYEKELIDINKRMLIEYFRWLNSNNDLAFASKKFYWTVMCGVVHFINEYYEDDLKKMIVIPKYSVKWSKNNHKKPETNKLVFATKSELVKILEFYKLRNHKYYLLMRTFIETGMRIIELVNIEHENVNCEKRTIETSGKTGDAVYFVSREMANLLKYYKESYDFRTKYLFESTQCKQYARSAIRNKLNRDKPKIGIEKQITPHTFRRTLNNFRDDMGCKLHHQKILLCHIVKDVTVGSYISKNYKKFIGLYDKYNPYINLNF